MEGAALEKTGCSQFLLGLKVDSNDKRRVKEAAKREATAKSISPWGRTWEEIISGTPEGMKKIPIKILEGYVVIWSYLTDNEQVFAGLGKKDAVKPIYHEATLEEEEQQQEQDRSKSQKGEVDRIVMI